MNDIGQVLQTYQSHGATTALYFAPLLPWQRKPWAHLIANINRLPHGMLFSGMNGIGKHAFVWRLSAWLLCDNDNKSSEVACGSCQSCLWLKAGTHPNLMTLPASSVLGVDASHSSSQNTKTNAKRKGKPKSTKKTKKSTASGAGGIKPDTIKIADIRNLTPFVSKSSHGRRICIIDNADNMTIAAANALLKTLEEPNAGVHLFLLSDMPAKLLPTIKSRVQKAPIDTIDSTEAQQFLSQVIMTANNDAQSYTIEQVKQLLRLASGAPLAALALINTPWYDKRQLWLTTWLALRANKRSSTAASDYWQQQLSLTAFIQLTEIMLMDIKRVRLGLPAKQQDLSFDTLSFVQALSFDALQQVSEVITDIKLAVYQNVQEKLGYDKLMTQLARM